MMSYLEEVGEAHGESTNNEAGVVEEQSEQLNIGFTSII